MEQRNNNQNSIIFQVEEILNKMSNQISFLIRKDKLMSQLDVDLLMENTRKLYDTLCSVKCKMNVDSIPMEIVEEEPENFRTLEPENFEDTLEEEEKENLETQRLGDSVTLEEELENFEDTLEEEEKENLETQRLGDSVTLEEELEDFEDTFEEEEKENSETQQLGDSVTLEEEPENFEDTFEEEEEENLETQRLGDSVTLEEELENFEDTFEEEKKENLETQRLGDSVTLKEEDSGIRAYKKEPQTIGDILELIEDNSLAARLQRKPVSDLMSAIGINDKFLLLNELFGGSMEKYNRSIRALNNFPTLLGARTYMSELQIEFQWDINTEAYKKLSDLIERRFSAIHNS